MFRMFSGHVLFESREKAITVLGDRAQEKRPVALPGQFDGRPRAARKPRGTRLNLHGFLGLIDTDYCGVYLPPLFFEFFVERFLFVSLSFSGCTAWFLMAQSRLFEQPPATRD